MALDLVILGESGEPEFTAALDVNTHSELIFAAYQNELASLCKLEDYYVDVQFSPEELEGLGRQTQILLQKSTSENLRYFLQALERLISTAVKLNSSIEALSD